MSQTLRGLGYTLSSAVADIVDNSISAGATDIQIDIDLSPADREQRIFILDNGCGMSEDKLISAMAIGSTSPLAHRSLSDLGRFGLGLKSASFSQCRRLVVLSKEKGKACGFCWDLDYIEKANVWELLRVTPDNNPCFALLDDLEHGTVVVWEKIDRSFGEALDQAKDGIKTPLYQQITALKHHLMLTFHRFLEARSCSISVNRQKLAGWNPFFETSPAKPKQFPETYWPDHGEPKVLLQSHVLPHPSACSGPLSLTGVPVEDLQGFYVYRNRRLISYGTWLGLRGLPKAPEFALARIRVDIGNDDDGGWELDVRKCQLNPPAELRRWLSWNAEQARNISELCFQTRGLHGQKAAPADYWQKQRGSYPAPRMDDACIGSIFRMLENGVLTHDILYGFLEILAATHPSRGSKSLPYVNDQEIFKAAEAIYKELQSFLGPEEARKILSGRFPFSDSSVKQIFNKE